MAGVIHFLKGLSLSYTLVYKTQSESSIFVTAATLKLFYLYTTFHRWVNLV